MGEEIENLKKSLHDVTYKNDRTLKESKGMNDTSGNEENKTIDPNSYAIIEKSVKDLYTLCTAERGDAKMGNASVVQLLNEIEKSIDRYLVEFKVSEEID